MRNVVSNGLSIVVGGVREKNLVEAVDTPESIRAIRNLLLLTKVFGNIPPEILNSLALAATEGPTREKSHKASGLSRFTEDCEKRTPGTLSL